jgi:hemoglobin-like flavoprotein
MGMASFFFFKKKIEWTAGIWITKNHYPFVSNKLLTAIEQNCTKCFNDDVDV